MKSDELDEALATSVSAAGWPYGHMHIYIYIWIYISIYIYILALTPSIKMDRYLWISFSGGFHRQVASIIFHSTCPITHSISISVTNAVTLSLTFSMQNWLRSLRSWIGLSNPSAGSQTTPRPSNHSLGYQITSRALKSVPRLSNHFLGSQIFA